MLVARIGRLLSDLEMEIALDGIAAGELPGHSMLGHMHLVDGCLGDIGW